MYAAGVKQASCLALFCLGLSRPVMCCPDMFCRVPSRPIVSCPGSKFIICLLYTSPSPRD